MLFVCFCALPIPVVWVVSAYCIILSRAHAEMFAINLSIFSVAAEVASQTNIIFQNATFGGKELNVIVLSQLKKKGGGEQNSYLLI